MQIGMIASTLESSSPEMMFTDANNPGEAISAVKAVQKAAQQGQRIYQITQQNMASVLPNVHHSAATTMTEIINALNAGKEVTTHTDAVPAPGWSEAGYIVLDPVTGGGAYRISGGGDGSYITGVLLGTFIVTSIVTTILTGSLLVVFHVLQSVLLHAVIIAALIAEDQVGFNRESFITGLMTGLAPLTFLTKSIKGLSQVLMFILTSLSVGEAILDLTTSRETCLAKI